MEQRRHRRLRSAPPTASLRARYVDRAHGRRAVGRERHPAVPRPRRPVDQARRAADERLPALPRRSAQGVGGAAEPDAGRCASSGTRSSAAASESRATTRLSSSRTLGVLRALITQNVDNLHRLAGSRRLLEIHGNATLIRCLGCVRALRARRDRLRRAAAALPALRRPAEERHRVVRRAHPARRARGLLRGGGARRLHDRRRHVGHRLSGGAVPDRRPRPRRRPDRGESLPVGADGGRRHVLQGSAGEILPKLVELVRARGRVGAA